VATDDNCIFCAIAAGTAPSYRVYEDETAVAFLDLAPVRQGHTLVIPRRHVPDVLADEGALAVADVAQAVHTVSRTLVDVFEADGVSVLQSNGAAAGQVVFHLHLHLLPRHHGDNSAVGWVRDADAAAIVEQTHARIVGS
jgi:histidine triad (HIT) family protein